MSSREKSPVGARPRPACRTLNPVPHARARANTACGCVDLCCAVGSSPWGLAEARIYDADRRLHQVIPIVAYLCNPFPLAQVKPIMRRSVDCGETIVAAHLCLVCAPACSDRCTGAFVHKSAAAFSTCISPPTHQGYSGCCCNARTHPSAASFSTKQHTSNAQILQGVFACAVKVELKVVAVRVPERDADRPSASKARRDCQRVQACAAQTALSAARKQFAGKGGSRCGGF